MREEATIYLIKAIDSFQKTAHYVLKAFPRQQELFIPLLKPLSAPLSRFYRYYRDM